jgi:KUP system potassium uptake protein
MYCWHRGSSAMNERLLKSVLPIDSFMAQLTREAVARVPGTAIFLTRSLTDTPPLVAWYVQNSRSLHERVLALTVQVESTPWVADAERLSVMQIAPNFWRAQVRYGFMERTDIPQSLTALPQLAGAQGLGDLRQVTYFVGLETIVPQADRQGLPRWQEALFAGMQRNATHLTELLQLPCEQVVEIGHQVSI